MFGTQNERTLDRIRPTVERVNALESSISPLSDDRLAAKIAEFRQRVANGEPLDDLLPRRSPSYGRRGSASSRCATSTSS